MHLFTIHLLIIGIIAVLIVLFFVIRRITSKKDKFNPDLSIAVESSVGNFCGIKLTNKGTGTAIIKKINFWENSNLSDQMIKKSIDQIFPINKMFWMNNTNFEEGRDYYLAGGESFCLGKLTKTRVIEKGGNYMKLKDTFDQKVRDIKIKIEYNDVFEKAQPPFLYNN